MSEFIFYMWPYIACCVLSDRETGLTRFSLIPDNGFVKVLKRGEE